MAALAGLGAQQNAFNLGLADLIQRKKMQEQQLRQAAIQNYIAYMQKQYEQRHAEQEAARRQKQMLGMKMAALGATAGLGGLGGVGSTATSAGAATSYSPYVSADAPFTYGQLSGPPAY